jgi:hypothetical protein
MADRRASDSLILSKNESSYGVDVTPVVASDALQVSNLDLNPLNATGVMRELVRSFMGGMEELVGDRYLLCTYGVELVGAGTAGAAAPIGPQLKAMGFTETLTAVTRADYTLSSSGFSSLTNYYHDSGVKHLSTGTRGTGLFRLERGDRPMVDCTMLGLYNAETAVAQPTPTLTMWKQPEAITNANSGDIVLGCTHTTVVAPALTGGTTYPSNGLRINLGNVVNHIPLLGGESIDIVERNVTGSMQLDLTAAQEVTLMAAVVANTLTSIGFVHGTVTGRKVLVFMPYCQLINPKLINFNGKRMWEIEFRAIPSTGNDELRIVTSF